MPEEPPAGEPIQNEDMVLRKIQPRYWPKLVGRTTPDSPAFLASSDGSGTSGVVVRQPSEQDETIELDPGRWVSLSVGYVRSLGLAVEWQAVPGTPRHAGIVNWPTSATRAKELRRLLCNRCAWIGEPPATR